MLASHDREGYSMPMTIGIGDHREDDSKGDDPTSTADRQVRLG